MAKGSEEPANNSWQQRAIDRSLSSARARALARSSQFLAAATELVEETGRVDFTVQSLVDRSKLSLRSFYQHFGGKDELLLALYEDLISQFVEDLRDEVLAPDEPLEQLETFCRAYMTRAEQSHTHGGRALTIYHLGLEIDRPADFVKSFEPQLELLTEILTACVADGVVRDDLSPDHIALLLSSTLMSLAQRGVLRTAEQGAELSGDVVWAWCLRAVSPLVPVASAGRSRDLTG